MKSGFHRDFGNTGLKLPPIVYGTSCLGNLYEALSDETKLAISREWFAHQPAPVVIDSAGKYGAGLALEKIGRNLRTLGISPRDIVISNKLGWCRVPLTTPEPTFEPGVWADLQYDAEQCIGYQGILDCWEQGCQLLGEGYRPQLLSVHDPDEYLAAAPTAEERAKRFHDVTEAYRALAELKAAGHTQAIGVGSKDWRVIQEIDAAVELDWVMLANSLTIYRHPPELLRFVDQLTARGVGIVNSAVFHAGFLVGGEFFDYVPIKENDPLRAAVFQWRADFHELCRRHDVRPAAACVQFALSPPGVGGVSLNTSDPARVKQNVAAVQAEIPTKFWADAKQQNLIDPEFPYLG
jgi:D-threo-aldose 1-dehydrogenase